MNTRYIGWVSLVALIACFSLQLLPGTCRAIDTRERNRHPNQVLDTFAFTNPSSTDTWEIALPNGDYYVTLSCGDAQIPVGPNRVVIEGTTVVDDVSTAAYQYYSVSDQFVTIADGKLTVEVGGAAGYTMLNFITISSDAPSSASFPIEVNFQPGAQPTPAGYSMDSGAIYDEGRGYGWDVDISGNTRDRGINADQRLDTIIYAAPSNEYTWTLDVPNGDYFVEISAGDPAIIAGPHRIALQGTTIINLETTTQDQYITLARELVSVIDGQLTMTIGDTDGYSEVNYIRVMDTPPALVFPDKLNFQPASSPNVLGFGVEGGFYYTSTRGYGFDTALDGRDRNQITDQLLDTLIYPSPLTTATWNYDVPNGTYYCFTAHGDALYPAGPHRVLIEGTNVTSDQSTAAGEFIEINNHETVVSDGDITIQVGGLDSYTEINYFIVDDAPKAAVTFPLNINYQLSSSTLPGGYEMDAGKVYDILRGWGWSKTIDARERQVQADQKLDTEVYTVPNDSASWKVDLPNDDYLVSLSVGDALYPCGPNRVVVEGTTVVNDVSLSANNFYTVTDQAITVSDGELNVTIGGANGFTIINYIEIEQAP